MYQAGILIASLFNKKARQWISGRKGLQARLETAFAGNTAPVIWVHCASLGEFEQGRPVVEILKKEYPSHRILLTFFSPSGYEIRKNYEGADWIFYLPLDTRRNAVAFVATVRPSLVVFVKYEYWYHFLHTLKEQKIPALLISAIFREHSLFFKPHGGFHRSMLQCFSHIFVQDAESRIRLQTIYPSKDITVAGDTRFDRVVQIAAGFRPLPVIESFVADQPFVIVAGSTWPEDEQHLSEYMNSISNKTALIIAPHEINASHINEILRLFPGAVLYSALNNDPGLKSNILIIDNIGMLSRLYYYAAVAYIGGGFNSSGIHNTLEAAVFSKPVVFGPNFQKFAEAVNLVKIKGGFSYSTSNQLETILYDLESDRDLRHQSGMEAGELVTQNKGATQIIFNYIRENLL
nr:glycosyltransferase N-terminal domain-containing protein [Niabella beijingensis]